MLGENVETKKEMEAKAAPAMATGRHPNLFTNAAAIGPEICRVGDTHTLINEPWNVISNNLTV